ncbi:uncharacterized protein LOC119162974 isoform X3 [Rhipicephalus microplus]|uniref:uncharacterized protein LOC119162974 isoform X3 n=1 Tax=Rhipicephalus microplus TaxID=6941 RepID=UPI003F6CC422
MTVENLCVCSRSPRTLQEELSGLRLFTVRTSHQESDQWQKRLHHWQLRCTLERLYQAELRHQMLHPGWPGSVHDSHIFAVVSRHRTSMELYLAFF